MPRPLTKADRALAATLARYLGSEAGVRRSAADVARELAPIDQRTPRTKDLVAGKAAEWVARGLAVSALGPRGGQGWALTEAGADLIARTWTWKSPGQIKAEREAADREARKVDWCALIQRHEGRETVTVRALTHIEAAELARRELRWTGERVLALWEAAAGAFVAAPL